MDLANPTTWAWIGLAASMFDTAAFRLMGSGSGQKGRHHYIEGFFRQTSP